jgi:aerobic carbon-monoxide dehydrogenase medium subunit
MLPRPMDYVAPSTVAAAVEALAALPDARFTAGSYRLIIDLKMRRIAVGTLVDLRRIEELHGLAVADGRLAIGAMVTLDTLARDARVQEGAAALARAAALTGDAQVRNMAAIGGTLAYDASSSDVAAAMLALRADVRTQSVGGGRTIAAEDFFAVGGGTALRRDEIVTRVEVPLTPNPSGYARTTHPASLAAVVGVAWAVERGGDGDVTRCALAVSGTVTRARRLAAAEAALTGAPLDEAAIARAAAAAADGVDWSPTAPESPAYRARRLGVMLARALRTLA